jgi:hypothetical protein
MEKENLKDKVFDKIIVDYGRNVLKVIQLPQNNRILTQLLKEEEHNTDIDFVIRKIIRTIVKS